MFKLFLLDSKGLVLWGQWEKISTLPYVSQFLVWRSQASLPTADPKRFSVAVAHLEGDKDHEHEELVVRELGNFDGIQILRFDRTIATAKGSQPEQAEVKGHATARGCLA